MDNYKTAVEHARASYAKHGPLLDQWNGEHIYENFAWAGSADAARRPGGRATANALMDIADIQLAGIEQAYGHDAAIKAMARAEALMLKQVEANATTFSKATQARFAEHITQASQTATTASNVVWNGETTLHILGTVCDALTRPLHLGGHAHLSRVPMRLLKALSALVADAFPAIHNAAEDQAAVTAALQVEAYRINVLTLPHLMMTHEVMQSATAQTLEARTGCPYLVAAVGEVVKALEGIALISERFAPTSNPNASAWLSEAVAQASRLTEVQE